MFGTFYGIGVGPGDPELLTLKAVRIIQESDILAIPAQSRDDCLAYRIARGAIPSLDQKDYLELKMPMTKNQAELDANHKESAARIAALLDSGKSVAFLTLGDPTVYSTYLYIHRRIKELGYKTCIINGIPSFCAAAASLNIGLVENVEALHIIPASYDREELLSLPGTKVLMKSGKQFCHVKKDLLDSGLAVSMVENCGLENEKRYASLAELPDTAGYYSLIIVKEDDCCSRVV
ncbi:MAG: precorrin-2 C(20)-methyltransferase [Lachnospiraceae bacterium]